MNPLRKCISLAGAAWLRGPSDANNYRLYGNREYIRDQSGTKWIKLWLNWAEMQPAAVGPDRAASWNDLSQRLQVELARLDAQIAAANADGIQVILGMYHKFPLWTVSPDTNGMPTNRERADRFPSDVMPNSPWDWFVGYFMARYKYHAPINPLGPREGYTLGNPVGAYITAFEVCSEPNELNWPTSVAHSRVANMIITAENASWYWGSLSPADYRIWVFGPGSGDISDSPTETSARVDYLTFTGRALAYLRDWWHPRAYCAWTHHNYNDIITNRTLNDTKASKVPGLLSQHNWRGGGDRYVWLTEGGVAFRDDYSSLDPAIQVWMQQTATQLIVNNYQRMMQTDGIYMYSQHVINDTVPPPGADPFKSGLRDDFDMATDSPGRPRELWWRWPGFPGSPGM